MIPKPTLNILSCISKHTKGLYLFFVFLALSSVVSCTNKQTSVYYSYPTLDANELQEFADSNTYQYTMFCTYNKYCDFCVEEFPKVYKFCKSLPLDFYVLFHVRATDSTYIYSCTRQIQQLDSSFTNFIILSDSLYDEQYRHISSNGIFKHYGGTIEGNKYYNYVHQYIPDNFDKTCATPKMILYEKDKGIVFVNQFEECDEEVTCLSATDKNKLISIVQGGNGIKDCIQLPLGSVSVNLE